MIPAVIYEMENFDRYLIQLNNKKPNVDMLQYVKRSAVRDFKITLDEVNDSSSEDLKEAKKRGCKDSAPENRKKARKSS